MELKRTFKCIAPILLVGILSFVFMSNRIKGYFPSTGGGGSSSNVADKNLTVDLYGISSLPKVNYRNYPCPATPYLGMGSNNYASSLDDLPFEKFYCVVTVTNMTNSSWGNNGKKTTIWNTASNQKVISVPGNSAYRVTVDYYEQKNQFWTNTAQSARGKWTSEYTFSSGYSGTYSFSFFTFVQQLF
ncbi:MAG TPA: hypothetical protein DCQ68_15050 [Chryseobacterium indologenes]|nr:hypothetical protein [Chryseobacterium indologenes]